MTIDTAELAAKADVLRAAHVPGRPLVLPNAWDAATARAVEKAGFPVVATTSAGVDAALGWPDGDQAPPDEVFAAIARICRTVSVPVTADLEGGYGLEPAELVERLLTSGAVGCNLEDTDHRPGAPEPLKAANEHSAFLDAVKEAGRAAAVDIVLNARVDVHVRQIGTPEEQTAEALRRAALYREAGADCIYPIHVIDEATIDELVRGIDAPTNFTKLPDGPTISRYAELGVARISYGGVLYHQQQHTLTERLAAIAEEAAAT